MPVLMACHQAGAPSGMLLAPRNAGSTREDAAAMSDAAGLAAAWKLPFSHTPSEGTMDWPGSGTAEGDAQEQLPRIASCAVASISNSPRTTACTDKAAVWANRLAML